MNLRENETHFWSRITKAGIIDRERSDVEAKECETQVGYLTQCKEMTRARIEENMERIASDLFCYLLLNIVMFKPLEENMLEN